MTENRHKCNQMYFHLTATVKKGFCLELDKPLLEGLRSGQGKVLGIWNAWDFGVQDLIALGVGVRG